MLSFRVCKHISSLDFALKKPFNSTIIVFRLERINMSVTRIVLVILGISVAISHQSEYCFDSDENREQIYHFGITAPYNIPTTIANHEVPGKSMTTSNQVELKVKEVFTLSQVVGLSKYGHTFVMEPDR